MPASTTAVNVSFFYDSSRSLYRIISVEGSKAVINSTVTPNMTFTKTSQKFGQWSDIRANTVYGLGFSSEAELGKVRYYCLSISINFSEFLSYFTNIRIFEVIKVRLFIRHDSKQESQNTEVRHD